MMMKRFLNITILIFVSTTIFAQQENNQVRGGNKRYAKEKYVDAEVSYRKALELNNKSFEANYNLGNALFKQQKYADALDFYQKAAALQTQDKLKMAATLHNLGNALLSTKKIEESINAYKRALKANPNDNETRYNLAVAQHLLKRQQQNQDKENEQQKEHIHKVKTYGHDRFETKHRRKDGSAIDVEITVKLFGVDLLVVFLRDITTQNIS